MSYYNYGGGGRDGGGGREGGGPLVPTGWGRPPRGDWGSPQNTWCGGWGAGGGGWGGGGWGGGGYSRPQPHPQPQAAASAWWMGGYHGGFGGGYGPPAPNRDIEQKPSDAAIEVGGSSITPGTNDHRVHENALKALDQVNGRLKIGVGCSAGHKNIAHIGEFRGAREEPLPQPQSPPPGYGVGVGINFRGY